MGNPRTCVACRQPSPREELVRLVRAPTGELVVDLKGRLPGRGAWVHPTQACAGKVQAHGGILKRPLRGQVDTSDLVGLIRQAVLRQVLDALSLAAASGSLVGGRDVLEKALTEGRVVAVVVASDASERTLRELKRVAHEGVDFTPLPLDREALGERVGRGSRAALGILATRASTSLRRGLRRLRDLG